MDNYNMRIKYLINTSCDILFRNENIIGFGRGRKEINGYNSKIPSLTIFVNKKLPLNMLRPYEVIPQKLHGAITDVVEMGKISYHNAEKRRPVVGGLSIGLNIKEDYGTLGYLVTDRATKKKLYLLSNEHVLVNKNLAGLKDVLQPCIGLGGTFPSSKIATVEKSIPRKPRINGDNTIFNEVDAAIAYIGPNTLETQKTIALPQTTYGWVVETIIANASIGDLVRKEGAATGATSGIVQTLDTTTDIGGYLYKNQITTNKMSGPGDSGSLGVLFKNNKAFGLLMAGSDTRSVYNPIDKVLNSLDVDIASPITH